MQVVRRKLAVAQPTVQYDNFMYEEGPDLEEDEAANYAKFLGRALNTLPAGGNKDSTIVEVSGAQKLELSISITHQVRAHHQHYVGGAIVTSSLYELNIIASHQM